jgi:excalibur calcium-binding domain-containing protein
MWLCLLGCAFAFPASASAEAPLTVAEGRASVGGVLRDHYGLDRDGDGIACES